MKSEDIDADLFYSKMNKMSRQQYLEAEAASRSNGQTMTSMNNRYNSSGQSNAETYYGDHMPKAS